VHLVFQAPDRTLTDEDADAARARIVTALRERLGAEPRACRALSAGRQSDLVSPA
jgi:hypothetical protein